MFSSFAVRVGTRLASHGAKTTRPVQVGRLTWLEGQQRWHPQGRRFCSAGPSMEDKLDWATQEQKQKDAYKPVLPRLAGELQVLNDQATRGDLSAMLQLFKLFDEGSYDLAANEQLAFDYLVMAAKAGHAMSQRALSRVLFMQSQVEKDAEKKERYLRHAKRYKEKAQAQGAAEELCGTDIAAMCTRLSGAKQDMERLQGAEYIQRLQARERFETIAESVLATAEECGLRGQLAEGDALLLAVADAGYAPAQVRVSALYQMGGAEIDYPSALQLDGRKAFHYMRLAAEEGEMQAQFAVAVTYYHAAFEDSEDRMCDEPPEGFLQAAHDFFVKVGKAQSTDSYVMEAQRLSDVVAIEIAERRRGNPSDEPAPIITALTTGYEDV